MTAGIQRRPGPQSNQNLSYAEIVDLERGPYGHGPVRWTDDAGRRLAWEANRELLVGTYLTVARHVPGSRPNAFWQYEAPDVPIAPSPDPRHDAPYSHLRYRALADRPADWWTRHFAAIKAQVAWLARHDLLEPSEISGIRNPPLRPDGGIEPWHQAALDGLTQETR